jgi:predicted dehydrogenase
MVRLALIGAGSHARAAHAPSLALYRDEHPGQIELAAVCDLDGPKAAAVQREFGFGAAYTDLDAMLDAERPDGVVAVLPVAEVAPAGVHLLERGIPCLIEKPPGDSPAAARRLLSAARASGTPHMVSVNRRFVCLLNRAREWGTAVGPLRFVRASMLRSGRTEEGFIWGTALHAVDAMRHLAGEVRECRARVHPANGLSAAWHEVAFRFADGCAGALHVFPTVGVEEETYELFGEGYRTRTVLPGAAEPSACLECHRHGALALSERSPEGAARITEDGSYDETCAFIRAVRDGAWPAATLEDVVPSLELCFGIAGLCRRAAGRDPWTWEQVSR